MPGGTMSPAYGGAQSIMRPPWPGVKDKPCDHCSWGFFNGVRQIKFINRMCPEHGHLIKD